VGAGFNLRSTYIAATARPSDIAANNSTAPIIADTLPVAAFSVGLLPATMLIALSRAFHEIIPMAMRGRCSKPLGDCCSRMVTRSLPTHGRHTRRVNV